MSATFNEISTKLSSKNPIVIIRKNINISNIRAKNVTASAAYIYALPEQPVEGLTLSNFSVEMAEKEGELKDKPIMAWHAPYTKGEGIYCANVKDSIFRDISVSIISGPGIEFVNGENVRVNGLLIKGSDEKVKLTNSDTVSIIE